jgi:hypothetical protein
MTALPYGMVMVVIMSFICYFMFGRA